MKKILFLISAAAACIILIALNHKPINHRPAVSINTTSFDITTANGVTMKYVVRGYEAKSLRGIDHGSCLNTTPAPELGKAGSIKSSGVSGTVDSKGNAAPVGTFYCAAYTRNMKSGVKYYARPYIKLSDETVLYGAERSITMK
jgi:hypothetical protein